MAFCACALSVNRSGLPAEMQWGHACLSTILSPSSFCRKWLVPPLCSLSEVTGLPNQWVTCICAESSAVTWKQLKADHKLEQIKKNLKQRSLWLGFMSREDLLGLTLNRMKYHSQGRYYASDLLLNDRVLPRKVAKSYCSYRFFLLTVEKGRIGPGRFFFPGSCFK